MRRRAVVMLLAGALLVTAAPAAAVTATASPPVGLHTVSTVPPGVQPNVVVRAGSDVVIFGRQEERARNAGAVFSTRRGRWSAMTRAPFEFVQLPRGVWTGHELLILGLACKPGRVTDEGECLAGRYVGGAYEPKTDRWRPVPIPERMRAQPDSSRTLGEGDAIGWSDGRAVFLLPSGFWAFDPHADRWQHLPDGASYSCATKRALAGLVGGNLSVLVPGGSRSEWNEAEPLPNGDTAGPFFLTCADDAVYVHPSVLTATWRYDLVSKRWETLPAPPAPAALTGAGAWTGRGFLVDITIRTRETFAISTDGFLFDPADARWRTVAGVVGLDTITTWSKGYAYTLGYDDTRRVTLQTYRPA
jgi:hypothetical protein